MVPFSKGEANTRAHRLNQAWITELMTLDFEKRRRKSGARLDVSEVRPLFFF
jgi:hypothetical protein